MGAFGRGRVLHTSERVLLRSHLPAFVIRTEYSNRVKPGGIAWPLRQRDSNFWTSSSTLRSDSVPRRRLRAKSDAAAGNMYRGTTMAGIIMDEAGHDPKRGFSGGYEMETLSLGLPFMATFLNPGAWGRSFTTSYRRLFEHGRDVARRRGPAAGDQPGHARSGGRRRRLRSVRGATVSKTRSMPRFPARGF